MGKNTEGYLEILNGHLRIFLTIKTVSILRKPYLKMIESDHKNKFLKQILVVKFLRFALKM